MNKYDFSGWATRNNIKCSDGRIILQDAFKHNDGKTVPLVWMHRHDEISNVLGHALLENRPDGVYTYGVFNDTEDGQKARLAVKNGDISELSIYANQLKQNGPNVVHGAIREVSLVLAGANPGAFIDNVMIHGDGSGDGSGDDSSDEAIIYTGETISLAHADADKDNTPADSDTDENITLSHADDENKKEGEPKMADQPAENKEKTVAEVFNTLNEEQKNVVYAMIAQALDNAGAGEQDEEDGAEENNGGDSNMKHNVFDNDEQNENKDNVLSHSDMEAIIKDANRYGSLKDSFIQHGIENIDYLFPDAQNVTATPSFIQRDVTWVPKVMKALHPTPFSRIKSMFADITEDDARAKGYIKGNLKKDEVFSLLKRTTTPTTVYKKQKMDRDDVIDITDFDVIVWIKAEMRMMLDEEIARACLVGDGRLASSDDKISEANIRPVWKDDDLYTIKTSVEVTSAMTVDQKAKAFIRACVKSRKGYKGSGDPVLYTTEDTLTDCLLMEDNQGRVIYESIEKLATAMRVKEIVTIPVMENLTRVDTEGKTRTLLGLVVNLDDYRLGADKGGAINLFDDFDIDYNKQKYLIETRCSGALVKPYSAIALEQITVNP
jgi:hypothetical protein